MLFMLSPLFGFDSICRVFRDRSGHPELVVSALGQKDCISRAAAKAPSLPRMISTEGLRRRDRFFLHSIVKARF